MDEDELRTCALLVLANKQDLPLPRRMAPDEVETRFLESCPKL